MAAQARASVFLLLLQFLVKTGNASENNTTAKDLRSEEDGRVGSMPVATTALRGAAFAASSADVAVPSSVASMSLPGDILGNQSLLPTGLFNRGWFPQGCNALLCNGNCPITANPTQDGGCCGAGSIGTGNKKCVTISSRSILEYECGLPTALASQMPICTDRADTQWWKFWSNKDIDQVCTLGGQSCRYIKYGWWTRKINLFGGNRQDKLTCSCSGVPTYRRTQDGPWTAVY